jgi:hypothetical protein
MCGRLKPTEPSRYFTANLRARTILREIAAALLAIVVSSTCVITLTGMALAPDAAYSQSTASNVPTAPETPTIYYARLTTLLQDTTWIMWVVVFATSSAFCVAILYRLHAQLVEGATKLHSDAIERSTLLL